MKFDSGVMAGPIEFGPNDRAAQESAIYIKFDGTSMSLVPAPSRASGSTSLNHTGSAARWRSIARAAGDHHEFYRYLVVPAAGVLSGLVTGSVYALLAVAVVIVFKTTDVPNFAQGEIFMVGATSHCS